MMRLWRSGTSHAMMSFFCGLSKEEMVYLHDEGFLKPIAGKEHGMTRSDHAKYKAK